MWTLFQTQTQQDRATGRQPQQEPCSVPKRSRHRPDPTPSQPPTRLDKIGRMDLTLLHNTASTQGEGETGPQEDVCARWPRDTCERVCTATPGFPRARPRPRPCVPPRGRHGQVRGPQTHAATALEIPPSASQPTLLPSLVFTFFFFVCVTVVGLCFVL